MPINSDMNDAQINQPSAFRPARPTAFGSPIAASPATMPLNTSGAITILIRRRKISVIKEKLLAISFAAAGESAD